MNRKKFIALPTMKNYTQFNRKEQYRKIQEELCEVINHTSRKNLIEEIGDVIMASKTLADIEGIRLEEIERVLWEKLSKRDVIL